MKHILAPLFLEGYVLDAKQCRTTRNIGEVSQVTTLMWRKQATASWHSYFRTCMQGVTRLGMQAYFSKALLMQRAKTMDTYS